MQQRLPIALPKAKFEIPGELEEEVGDDAAVAAPGEGDPEDSDPEVPSSLTQSLADQIHTLTARFDAY